MKSYEKTKLYDLAMAMPLIGFYGWEAVQAWPGMIRATAALRATPVRLAPSVDLLSQALSFLFGAILVLLLLLRTVPTAKSGEIVPRIAAVLGTFAALAFLRLPAAALPLPVGVFSATLILAGTFATMMALLWLGRSFSIMPEARRLVTRGPYAFVRHPVYLCEEITIFGMMLQHAQPWSFFLFAGQCALQLARMQYEENVLTASFPEYRAYAARTARLIPGIY